MAMTTQEDVYGLIETLKSVKSLVDNLHNVLGTNEEKETNQLTFKVQRGIDQLEQLLEGQKVDFNKVVGNFITRAQARPLRKEYKKWADDMFRAGPIKNLKPLYVSCSQIEKLLERTNRGDDNYLEFTFGKSGDILCVMLAAVTHDGQRLYDPNGLTGGQDILDDMGPCPPNPRCPQDLDQ